MRKLLVLFNFFSILSILSNIVLADDLRDLKVGTNILKIPDRGYTNFKCINNIKVNNWKEYKKCEKNNDDLYIIKFEYDERYALNENFEGTQVSGHPVLINLAIDNNNILQEININTDPEAPFYFRKQAHLLWLRIYYKYGGKDWECNFLKQKEGHIKIGKKYINKICTKTIENKDIKVHSQFYFIGDKTKKENLVSKTFLQIKNNRL